MEYKEAAFLFHSRESRFFIMAASSTGNRKLTKIGIHISHTQLEPQFKQGYEFYLEIDGDKINLKKA